jgi:pyruvate/2-oxoglutarate dehydrogenase complex dihydrolipoamide dehydrogenase (E3) component
MGDVPGFDARARYDLLVLGAGPAGLVAAAGAAALGARVALVERDRMGGDCLNTGCVPSKALLRVAKAVGEVRRAHALGIRCGDPSVDFAAVMERMRQLRARIAEHDSAARFRSLGVHVMLGEARFVGPDAVEVGGSTVRFGRALIATGAQPDVPDVPGLAGSGYLTSDTVFDLAALPARLAILGGGPLGCELAQAFARFGARVTILHKGERLMERDDADAVAVVRRALERDGIQIHTGVEVASVTRSDAVCALTYRAAGGAATLEADALLVAAGRRPAVDRLDLDAAGIAHDTKRGVRVDDFLRTTNPHVFAAGDVCGGAQFTHVAGEHARIVVQNALFVPSARASRIVVPWCTFTDPELAHVGRASGEMVRQDLTEVDRAVLDGEEDGFVKLYLERGRLVGATIVAAHAGETIAEAALAIVSGAGVAGLARTLHPYPTQAEALRTLADRLRARRLRPWMRRALSRWFAWTR